MLRYRACGSVRKAGPPSGTGVVAAWAGQPPDAGAPDAGAPDKKGVVIVRTPGRRLRALRPYDQRGTTIGRSGEASGSDRDTGDHGKGDAGTRHTPLRSAPCATAPLC